MKSLIAMGATAAMLALTAPASAATLLTLVGPIDGHNVGGVINGPQSASNPCIIAATMCQNGGFPFNNFVQGGVDNFNESQSYTVAQLLAAVGSLFNVALDVNASGAATDTLNVFTVTDTTTATVLYTCCAAPNTLPKNVAQNISNNGNGWADWLMETVNLAGLKTTDTITFNAQMSTLTDGGESFFLIQVPGPLAGAGLPGLVAACGGLLALARRRRQQIA